MMRWFLLLFSLLVLPGVLAATASSNDFEVIIVEETWGGAITDDGTNFFLIRQGTFGFLTSSDGTTFSTLPPFPGAVPSTGGDPGSGSGGGIPGDLANSKLLYKVNIYG